jgi:gliding motility-associated lipoprotein GldD
MIQIKRKIIRDIAGVVLFMAAVMMASCHGHEMPKPEGYFRIDTPVNSYAKLDSIYPYTFEYSAYARIIPDYLSPDQPYWINIDYPQFKGKIHLSYKPVRGNLVRLLEDSRSLVIRHIPKATSIDEELVVHPDRSVFGMIYDIKGFGAASPCQFFLTDSTSHFLRGALYFNVRPNNDSLAPVIDFVNKDIHHLIDTFHWKEAGSKD